MKQLSRDFDEGVQPAPEAAKKTGVLHLGLGAFHRGHQAHFFDRILASGDRNWGVASVNLRSSEIVTALQAQDNLYCRWEKGASTDSIRVIGSLTGSYHFPTQTDDVMALFQSADVRIITVSVSEKGYHYDGATKRLETANAEISADVARPDRPTTLPGILAAGLEARRLAGTGPVTVISCDNYQDNGAVLHRVVTDMTRLCYADLLPWLETSVRFPSSMVDGIVPPVREEDRTALAERIGVYDPALVIAEDYMRWVIEDDFAAERPALENVGVEIVSDPTPYETMKLQLLNAPHSALAYLGYNAGFEYVHEAVADPCLHEFLMWLIADELLPVSEQLEQAAAREYAGLTLKRFANPNIAYRTGQVVKDGSLKIPQRLLPAATELISQGKMPTGVMIVLAAWARYVSGRDETGVSYEIVDPLADTLSACHHRSATDMNDLVECLLSIRSIFPPMFGDDPVVSEQIVFHLNGFADVGPIAWLKAINFDRNRREQ